MKSITITRVEDESVSTLLLPSEAAQMIHPSVKEASVRALMRHGHLAQVRIGARHYTNRESVSEYLAS